jgi:membrane protein YdbS with pleckstrin-like domain
VTDETRSAEPTPGRPASAASVDRPHGAPSVTLVPWVYEGIWGILADLFQVPRDPPPLPAAPGESCDSFRPAPGFVRYLLFQFWIVVGLLGLVWLGIVIAAALAEPVVGVLLVVTAPPLIVPALAVAYIAIHLRYDTCWYVIGPRSLRIRRGIWVVRETTMTFENIQNVTLSQGPLQRWFGIGALRVETAGGGGGSSALGESGHGLHTGLIEGISNAEALRDRILSRLGRSRDAGLGDSRAEDAPRRHAPARGWRPQHIALLREIRDLLARA